MSMSRYRHSAVDVDHLDKDPVGVVIRVKNLSNYNGNNNVLSLLFKESFGLS